MKKAKQERSKTKNNININLHANNKTKQLTNFFISGPGIEADWVASVETTIMMHEEFIDVFTEIGCIKPLSSYRLRMIQSYTRHCWGA